VLALGRQELVLMKACTTCGSGELVGRRGAFEYTQRGLSGIWLEDVRIALCLRCRAEALVVDDPRALERALVSVIIQLPGPLRGAEIRFLRSAMHLSGIELSRLVGVTASVLSRWENDRSPIGPQSDRLLRILVARDDGLEGPAVAALLSVDRGGPRPKRTVIRYASGAWKAG